MYLKFVPHNKPKGGKQLTRWEPCDRKIITETQQRITGLVSDMFKLRHQGKQREALELKQRIERIKNNFKETYGIILD